jgi:sortase A
MRIIIPAIALDAPVTKAKYRKILLQGDVFDQWVAPDQFAAGWIATSAFFGENGNTVLVGHHNEYGEVFGRLIDLNVGDTIVLFSAASSRAYKVTNKMILQELDVPVAQRIQNARWIGRSNDERLTLVTCWPKETNSHRLIIVASPN